MVSDDDFRAASRLSDARRTTSTFVIGAEWMSAGKRFNVR